MICCGKKKGGEIEDDKKLVPTSAEVPESELDDPVDPEVIVITKVVTKTVVHPSTPPAAPESPGNPHVMNMILRDSWSHGSTRNDFEFAMQDSVCNCLAMHYHVFKDKPPNKFKKFAKLIPGQASSYKDRLTPLEAKVYLEAQAKSKKEKQELKYKLWKNTDAWKNKKYPSDKGQESLKQYTVLTGSLQNFICGYFTDKKDAAGKCYMMFFDDGESSFCVYGFKDGRVYLMDAHKVTSKYMSYKTDEELDDPNFPSVEFSFPEVPNEALKDNKDSLINVPIEDLEKREYLIMSIE